MQSKSKDHDEARADIVVTEDGRLLKNRWGPKTIVVMVVRPDGSYVMNENRS